MLWAVSPGRTLQDASPQSSCKATLPVDISFPTRRSMNGYCGDARDVRARTAVLSRPSLRPDRRYGSYFTWRSAARSRAKPLSPPSRCLWCCSSGSAGRPITASPIRSGCSPLRSRCLSRRLPMPSGRRRRGASCRTHHRHRAHGQMELPARGAEPRACARRHAGDAAHLSGSPPLLVPIGAALPILPFLLWLATIEPGLIGRRAVPPGSGLSAERSLKARRLHHRHPAGVSAVDPLRTVFAWRFPKAPLSSTALTQAVAIRVASLSRDTRADGRAPAGRHCVRRRAVRHHPFRHSLSLPVLPVRGAGACRRRGASRSDESVRAKRLVVTSLDRGLGDLHHQARKLHHRTGRRRGDKSPALRAVGAGARSEGFREGAVRNSVAARCRQSHYSLPEARALCLSARLSAAARP